MNNKRKSKKNQKKALLIGLIIVFVLILGVLVFLLVKMNAKDKSNRTGNEITEANSSTGNSDNNETTSGSSGDNGETGGEDTTANSSVYAEALGKARITAAMYDYDKAIEDIKSAVPDYDNYSEVAGFIEECIAKKNQLVKWADNSKITHVFFHSLVMDCETAFASESGDNYNQVMTTIDEFNKIIQSMYDKGYVLVRLSDIASIDPETGHMKYNDIYLPAGKIPFVLSEDDVSYYEYMNLSGGFPQRLVVAEDGRIMNEVDNPDGTVTVGPYDVVPILDMFVEEHPDFSYHGAKGILALTGYNGILGYRTSYICYGSDEVLQSKYNDLFCGGGYDSNTAYALALDCRHETNVNIKEDREKATAVAAAMKAEGWEFASHTWGHANMGKIVDTATGTIISEQFTRDTTWWEVEVAPLVGGTDTIIFAFGADIYTWKPYQDDNQAFNYLKAKGFNYFCNVDSQQYYVQMSETVGGSGFLRQGRRNLDGQMMFKSILYPEQNLVADLFDAKAVFDRSRPLPVQGVTLPEGYSGINLEN